MKANLEEWYNGHALTTFFDGHRQKDGTLMFQSEIVLILDARDKVLVVRQNSCNRGRNEFFLTNKSAGFKE